MNRLLNNRTFQHLLFWGCSYVGLLFHFGIETSILTVWLLDHLYTLLFHVSLFFCVYVNLGILIPRFLTPRKYVLYIVGCLGTIVIAGLIHILIFDYGFELFDLEYYFISLDDYWNLFQYFVIYIGLSALLHLSKSWFKIQEVRRQQVQAELKALKSQVNPHFLFNTLNSLYALTLKSSPQAPEAILKLSEVMRYMLYEANEAKVPLRKELGYLENYMALQQLRLDERVNISYVLEGEVQTQQIVPLLLIVFLENAFKYGTQGDCEQVQIELMIQVEPTALYVRVFNSVCETGREEEFVDVGQVEGGIGLENVKRRLELLYPDQHQLEIHEQPTSYEVQLHLQL